MNNIEEESLFPSNCPFHKEEHNYTSRIESPNLIDTEWYVFQLAAFLDI